MLFFAAEKRREKKNTRIVAVAITESQVDYIYVYVHAVGWAFVSARNSLLSQLSKLKRIRMSDVRSGPRFSSTLRSSIVDQFVDFAWLAHPSRVWDLVRIAHRETVDSGAIMLHVISVQHEYEGLSVVPETSTFPFDASHSVELDDLCDMNNLHEAPLLYTLEKRLQRDMIYTSASNIVISINPYRNIPGLFDNPMEFYETGKVTATDGGPMLEKPHVYGVANKVLSSLVNAGPDDIKNQSVVISGEVCCCSM